MKLSQEKYLAEFKKVTDTMYETTKRKNSDYTGDAGDAFKNFTQVENATDGKVSTEEGFFTRITDKYMRFAGFIKNGTLQVADEKIEDTLLDMAVYCILFVIYRRNKKASISGSAYLRGGVLNDTRQPLPYTGDDLDNGTTILCSSEETALKDK